jgi:hypothetical protein
MSVPDATIVSASQRAIALARRHPVALWLLGALLCLAWAWRADWPAPVVVTDINQHRVSEALAPPQGDSFIRQTFVPAHDGLSEVEILLSRADGPDGDGQITLRLVDGEGRLVAERTLATAGLAHNQPFTLRFSPQPRSAGQQYTLRLTGNAANTVSAWAYGLNVHQGGELTVFPQETAAQDLRLVTRYQLTATIAARRLLSVALAEGPLLLVALAFILMPGCLLLLLGWRWSRSWDAAAWLGVAVSVGVAAWPLLWLWPGLLGLRWSGWLFWLVLAVGWGLVPWLLYNHNQRQLRPVGGPTTRKEWPARATRSRRAARAASSTSGWTYFLLLTIILLGLAARLLAVRDLLFPTWVDSTRHALITAVMSEKGQPLDDYRPYLDVSRFPYHYGYHSLASSLSLLTGWPLFRLLLLLGQLLNALAPLTVYAGAWLMTRRRAVGLVAAFLVALPYFFPAYYATWGRFTQLAAMVIMPGAIGLTWRLARGARVDQRAWWLAGVLAAGLFLAHFRVFLLYLPFAGLVGLVSLRRRIRPLLLAAGAGLLLALPRAIELARASRGTSLIRGVPADYNAFPTSYVTVGWERFFLALGLAAVLLAIPAAARRRAWAAAPALLGAWVGALLLLLSGRAAGLPESWLINLNSAYITFFLPLALVTGIAAVQLWRGLRRFDWRLQIVAHALAGAALAGAALFGLRQQVAIINPQTILAERQDLDGLLWLNGNAPADSLVAVGSWLWLGTTWAGSDGGAWVTPLTGLASTTPPVDYIYNPELATRVTAFNEAAMGVTDWSHADAAELLRREGVDFVFVGARGGFLDPIELAHNPALERVFQSEGVFVFALR